MSTDAPHIFCTRGDANAKITLRVTRVSPDYVECVFALGILMDPPTEFSRPLTLEREYLRRFCAKIRVANRYLSRTTSTVELPDKNGTTALRVRYERRGFSRVVVVGGMLVEYCNCACDDLSESYLNLVTSLKLAGIAVVYDNLRTDVEAIERFVDAVEKTVAEEDANAAQ